MTANGARARTIRHSTPDVRAARRPDARAALASASCTTAQQRLTLADLEQRRPDPDVWRAAPAAVAA